MSLVDDFSVARLVSVTPQRTTYSDLVNITKVTEVSTTNDPLILYIFEDRVETRWTKAIERLLRGMLFKRFVDTQTAWQIDSGDAFLFYSDPTKPSRREDKAVGQFARFMSRFSRSKEQRKRTKECEDKLNAAIKEALGDRTKDMFYLDHLATTPAKQGRGYGTALCEALTDEADVCGKASYVVSSNVEVNTAFYNHVGYFTVKEFLVGDDNPTWKKLPVVIAVMVRELASADSKPEC